ncbi:DUF5666 domain-containing protein [Methylotenera sp.]|uniref:DUF5666 domain-containing protein n=1 Tax=Methylotenera sp. TaxID=2051956 RepID=UPI0024882157|nr:DUF5666 domain-containing protein [Methylotenera sp.]MDI1362879.1 DUF5666 domain-containing protein [Methylotenera sp.]
MKTYIHNFIAIILTILSLSANANPCDDGGIGGTGMPLSLGTGGIGGTGNTSDKSTGIGGTGITSAQEGIGGTGVTNKGIGGTGVEADSGIGGTGIVGIITGFGSICVNGLEVHYYNDTPMDLDGKKISSDALAVGQVVAVKAHGKEQSLIAHEIHAFYQVTGPITAIDLVAKKIKVMDQSINANDTQINNMKIGQWLSVSGLRSEDGSIEASRIDQSTERKIAKLVGNLSMQGNNAYIGGTKIDGISNMNNNPNADARLTGVWDGSTFNVKDMKPGPVSDLLQKVEVFHLQGIAGSNVTNGKVKLSGQTVAVPANIKILGNSSTSIAGKPIVAHGQVKDGKAKAQSIELRPMKTEVKNRMDRPVNSSQSNSSGESGENTSANAVKATASNKSEIKPKKADKTELSDRVYKQEQVEKVERAESIERVETVERVERVETPERVEKVEKVERVETPDRVEKVERVEKRDD